MDWDGTTWGWWLVHGFDGIAAGLVAVGGLAITLWFDRRARRDDRDRERDAEHRQTVNTIMVTAIDISLHVQQSRFNARGLRADLKRLEREIKVAQPTLIRIKGLGSQLIMLGAMGVLVADRAPLSYDLAGRLADSAASRCRSWLLDPARYDGARQDQAETHVYGDTVVNTILYTPGDELEPPSP